MLLLVNAVKTSMDLEAADCSCAVITALPDEVKAVLSQKREYMVFS
jgi:hypothetical protein